MAQLVCENVARGMREEERTVSVRNAVTGERSFVRVESDFLTQRGGKFYLPVGVVQEEPQQGLVLVELPQAPDAGNTRLWVRSADLLRVEKIPARSFPLIFETVDATPEMGYTGEFAVQGPGDKPLQSFQSPV